MIHPSLTLSQLALLTAAAFAAGLVDAIAGGGGLVTLPALLAAGLPPHLALGTNKGQSVFGSSAATVAFLRRGMIDRKRALVSFPAGFAGSLLGAALVLWVSPGVLRPLVIALLVLAAAFVALRRPLPPDAAVSQRSEPRGLVVAVIAGLIGAYDGFFGPGTGTFLIVAFVAVCHEPLVRASAAAKVVNFASNLAAVALFASRGTILWNVALPMAVAQLSGGTLGARLAMRGGDRLVRRVVLAVVFALCIKLAVDLVRA